MSVTSTVSMHWPQTGTGATDYERPSQIVATNFAPGETRVFTVRGKMWAAKESQREFLRRKKR